MKNKSHQKGFTLLEIIAALILVGIIGATLGIGITQIINGFVFSKKNAETARKAQLAMIRLVKELKSANISDTPLPTATSITFSGDATYTVSWSAGNPLTMKNPLTMDSYILTDNVSDFKLTYYDLYNSSAAAYSASATKLIGITLKLKGAEDIILTFEDRVFVKKP